jgi:pyruvate dehydrogenase E1 component
MSTIPSPAPIPAVDGDALACLRTLERRVLWLSTWMIHHANHLRPNRDGLKVGGHQASSASVATLMTALYFHALRPEDRVAVKPHASPIFHAIQYLLGRQTRERLGRFRAFGGAQSYPSRTKDADDVDFSTGSVGLGVAVTVFASLVQDYVRLKGLVADDVAPGRMVAVVGDAEFDEGNVFEAMLEGWKHDVRNVWWVVDYNRQSLDSVVSDRLFTRLDDVCRTTGFDVVTLKYGTLLHEAFARRGGDALRRWIDECPNSLYSALTYKGGAAWRTELIRDLGDVSGIRTLLDEHDDASLHRLMTNLAGHDMEAVLRAFTAATDDRMRCFIAYTIKGYGLPFAGHKDNHAGLMSPEQMAEFRATMGVPEGREWDPDAVAGEADETRVRAFLAAVPFARATERQHEAAPVPVPARVDVPSRGPDSTQGGFGKILSEIAGAAPDLAARIVTTSPDVTVSTNLGGWVNRRGIFDREERADVFRDQNVLSPQRWLMSSRGQHFELGIAEHNLFLMLAALGLAAPLFGVRLLPIGTLYDPFILRGLDALNYACYQDARFIVVATPSGLTLAPEGGAHQSIITPLIGLGQDRLTWFEPAYVDELAEIMRWSFEHLQAPDGGSVCLRLSTRPLAQPERVMTDTLRADVLGGAYWQVPPQPGSELAIAYCGAVAPEAIDAHAQILEDVPGAGLLAVTSADRLHAGWRAAQAARAAGATDAQSHLETLLAPLASDGALVTVLDGHPAALSWLGAVRGHRVYSRGVDHFGQSGDLPDLYAAYDLDVDAIVDAVAAAVLRR